MDEADRNDGAGAVCQGTIPADGRLNDEPANQENQYKLEERYLRAGSAVEHPNHAQENEIPNRGMDDRGHDSSWNNKNALVDGRTSQRLNSKTVPAGKGRLEHNFNSRRTLSRGKSIGDSASANG